MGLIAGMLKEAPTETTPLQKELARTGKLLGIIVVVIAVVMIVTIMLVEDVSGLDEVTAIAQRITEALAIPTIGIGAGVECDGQVLVWHDLLGLYEGKAPRFVKRYADLAGEAKRALEAYADDVRERRFPEERHTYAIPDEELALFEAGLTAGR